LNPFSGPLSYVSSFVFSLLFLFPLVPFDSSLPLNFLGSNRLVGDCYSPFIHYFFPLDFDIISLCVQVGRLSTPLFLPPSHLDTLNHFPPRPSLVSDVVLPLDSDPPPLCSSTSSLLPLECLNGRGSSWFNEPSGISISAQRTGLLTVSSFYYLLTSSACPFSVWESPDYRIFIE